MPVDNYDFPYNMAVFMKHILAADFDQWRIGRGSRNAGTWKKRDCLGLFTSSRIIFTCLFVKSITGYYLFY